MNTQVERLTTANCYQGWTDELVVINILNPVRVGYICLFSVTAITCFGVIPRARSRIDDTDTQWGLTTLLGLSGFWAAFHVGRLVASSADLQITFYILGLIVGLATVGAWLHFCSAYAGESYHRQGLFRLIGLIVYVSIIGVKITSPIHGLYFTTTPTMTPFPHLIIRFGAAHWIVTGLAYTLSAIGFYILFDMFQESGYVTRRLGGLVGLAGLPVIFDLIGYINDGVFLTFNYEPVGVALFALGVLYLADGTFIGVRAFGREQLFDELDEAVIILDRSGVIRDVNVPATCLFPELVNSTGTRLETLVPELADHLPLDSPTQISRTDAGATCHYLLSATQLTAGETVIGQALVYTEITRFKRQQEEIERQHSRLDDLSEAITHELRNTLNIAQGNIDLARSSVSTSNGSAGLEELETAGRMTDRMETLIADLATLAQLGQTTEKKERIDIERVAKSVSTSVTEDNCKIYIEAETIKADTVRLERLFEKLFSFAVANGATKVNVSQQNGVLTLTDNGEHITSENIDAAFSYGQAVPDGETGMLLPVARTLVEAHGWDITIDEAYQSGVRILITTDSSTTGAING